MAAPSAPSFELLPASAFDRAVDRLVLGAGTPSVDELTRGQLAFVLPLIAHVLHTYEQADFNSFLELRAMDLDDAARRNRDRVLELRTLALELGVSEASLPHEWTGALRAFWEAYYVQVDATNIVASTAADFCTYSAYCRLEYCKT